MFSGERLDTGSARMLSFDAMEGGVDKVDSLGIVACTEIIVVKWVIYQGCVYRPEIVVCRKVELEMPQFFQISSVLVKDDRVLLTTLAMDTLSLINTFMV